MTKKIYIIETVSMHRMAYCIEADSNTEAENILSKMGTTGNLTDFGQTHIGENIFYSQEVSQEEYLQLFDELNDYLKDIPTERKLSYIMKANNEG